MGRDSFRSSERYTKESRPGIAMCLFSAGLSLFPSDQKKERPIQLVQLFASDMERNNRERSDPGVDNLGWWEIIDKWKKKGKEPNQDWNAGK